MFHHPVEALAAIATIDPHQTQFLASATESLKEQLGAITVLDRNSGNDNRQQQASHIDV